jgi:FixJ family two-component response regulator
VLISGQVGGVDNLDPKSRFLPKPFNQEELLETIRDLFPKENKKQSKQQMHPLLKNLLGGDS